MVNLIYNTFITILNILTIYLKLFNFTETKNFRYMDRL